MLSLPGRGENESVLATHPRPSSFPPPLWGRVGRGVGRGVVRGRAVVDTRDTPADPHPSPSPQGGGENSGGGGEQPRSMFHRSRDAFCLRPSFATPFKETRGAGSRHALSRRWDRLSARSGSASQERNAKKDKIRRKRNAEKRICSSSAPRARMLPLARASGAASPLRTGPAWQAGTEGGLASRRSTAALARGTAHPQGSASGQASRDAVPISGGGSPRRRLAPVTAMHLARRSYCRQA